MSADYAVGHGKPPRHTQFRKGQSGNPGGRPGVKKVRRLGFAEMLDAAMCESTELVATTPCKSIYAASAKGMALDCVRGKIGTVRQVFAFLDELDGAPVDGRQRRGFDRKLEAWEAVDAARTAAGNEQGTHPVSQGVIDEEPFPEWSEYAEENLGRSPAEAPVNSQVQGIMEVRRSEAERRFLAEAARKPDPKEIKERERLAARERERQLLESVKAKVQKAMSRTTPCTEEEIAGFERTQAP